MRPRRLTTIVVPGASGVLGRRRSASPGAATGARDTHLGPARRNPLGVHVDHQDNGGSADPRVVAKVGAVRNRGATGSESDAPTADLDDPGTNDVDHGGDRHDNVGADDTTASAIGPAPGDPPLAAGRPDLQSDPDAATGIDPDHAATGGREAWRRRREARPARPPFELVDLVLEPMEFDELPGDDYQNLWFQLRTWSWRSIAVLPMESTSELDLAEQLVVIGVANTHRRMTLISAEGVTLRETDALIAAIRAAEDRGDLVVVCVDSVDSNPATAPIVRAVNGVVLCVRLERSSKRALNHAMRLVGRRRILGVVTRSVP